MSSRVLVLQYAMDPRIERQQGKATVCHLLFGHIKKCVTMLSKDMKSSTFLQRLIVSKDKAQQQKLVAQLLKQRSWSRSKQTQRMIVMKRILFQKMVIFLEKFVKLKTGDLVCIKPIKKFLIFDGWKLVHVRHGGIVPSFFKVPFHFPVTYWIPHLRPIVWPDMNVLNEHGKPAWIFNKADSTFNIIWTSVHYRVFLDPDVAHEKWEERMSKGLLLAEIIEGGLRAVLPVETLRNKLV